MRLIPLALALCVAASPAWSQTTRNPPEAIDKVWAGHSARFAMVASQTYLYVAYYDANRQLTVAQRPLNNPAHWIYHKVDTWLGWDSHNYIAMALDGAGAVHIAGNMHVDPLTYFRSDPGGDVRTLKRMSVMVDPAREKRMTYPIFLKDGQGRLIYKYRDGSSGDGNELYNVYDESSQHWKALTSSPLVDGEGERNAYFVGPVLGPDGYFHIAWVWRETPMAETNHDLSYARTRDLIHWEKADGTPLALPIRLDQAEIVDPVPVRGGMINNNTVIGFDDQGRTTITYHKYDSAGNTQIWLARREDKGWTKRQISAWSNYRWDFGGGGSLNSEIFVRGAHAGAAGQLIVPVVKLGQSLEFILDAKTLKLIEERKVDGLTDIAAREVRVTDGQRLIALQATAPDGRTFTLAWGSLPPNRDLPRTTIPAPSDLVLLQGIADVK